jgi:hypothetical protein
MFWKFVLVFSAFLSAQLAADPLPVPAGQTLPEFTPPPRTRALDTIGEARRKTPGELPASMPATAPDSYTGAIALSFPDPDAFDLSFSQAAPGWYTAPDGARVYQWGRDHWSWETKSGAKIVRWPNGTSLIEFASHRILKFPNRDWPGTIEWNFPDRSKLTRHPWPEEQTVVFTYERMEPRAAYQLWAPGKWAPLASQFDRYSFHYSPAWADHIEAFKQWGKLDEFFGKMEDLFGFKNAGPIPVVFFEEIGGMRRQLRDQRATEGGRGGLFGISICCGNKRHPFSTDNAVRRVQLESESFPVLLHETVHNLQQHRCFYARAGKDFPPARDPGPWYVEGVAEVGMMQLLPRERARKYRELYAKLQKETVQFENVGYADGSVYVYGTFMLEYVMRTLGPAAIRDFYDDTCRGMTPDQSAQKHFRQSPRSLLEKSMAYFRANKDKMEAEADLWEMEGLPAVSYADSTLERPALTLVRSHREITQIPSLRAWRMNTDALEGKFEGHLRGPGHERVYLWKNGTQLVTDGRRKITFFKEGSASLSVDGHTILEWKGDLRKWTLPDGSSALQRDGRIEYTDAPEKKLP